MSYAFPVIAGHNTQTFTFPADFKVDPKGRHSWGPKNDKAVTRLATNFNKCMAGAPDASPPVAPQPALAYSLVFIYQPHGTDGSVALQQALSGNKPWPSPADGAAWAELINEFAGNHGGDVTPAVYAAMSKALGFV